MSDEHGNGHSEQPIIIIRKIKRIKKGGHHGGAWKIAYADFVTAMMAFFLLMWLLSLLNKYQLQGISDYFKKPLKVIFGDSDSLIGKKGKSKPTKIDSKYDKSHGLDGKGQHAISDMKSLSGESPTKISNKKSIQGRYQSSPLKASAIQENNKDIMNASSKSQAMNGDASKKDAKNKMVNGKFQNAPTKSEIESNKSQSAIQKMEAMRGQLVTKQSTDPQMRQYKNLLNFIVFADGLKIELKDDDTKSLFMPGKAELQPYSSLILSWLSWELNNYPNRIAIIGHTDSSFYRVSDGYSNWELSADRANAVRRALIKFGMDASKIIRVIGMADSDPADKNDAFNPSNRRMDIVVLTDEAMKKMLGEGQ